MHNREIRAPGPFKDYMLLRESYIDPNPFHQCRLILTVSCAQFKIHDRLFTDANQITIEATYQFLESKARKYIKDQKQQQETTDYLNRMYAQFAEAVK